MPPLAYLFFMGTAVLFYTGISSALMRTAGRTVAGFRPRFRFSVSSCLAGFLTAHLLGLILGKMLHHDRASRFFVFMLVLTLIALPIFTAYHAVLLRNRGDQRPTLSQAARLASIQAVVGIVGSTIVWAWGQWLNLDARQPL